MTPGRASSFAAIPLAMLACATVSRPDAPAPGNATSAAAPAPSAKGIETGDLSRGMDPCDDFYAFSGGGYRAHKPIPASRSRWSRRIEARDAIEGQLRAILEELSAREDWPTGSAERRLGDHYASCMDETSIDAAGLIPLGPLLADIAAAQSPTSLQRAIRRLHDLAIPVPFAVSGAMDYREPSRFVASVAAGRRGLPDREAYLGTEPRSVDAREKYRAHVARLLELGGMPAQRCGQAADRVLALEAHLVAASLDDTAAADPARTDHRTTFAELQRLAPHFGWAAYFDEAGMPRREVNVTEPDLLKRVDAELAETPLTTWRAYLTFQLLDVASPWLSRPFVVESFAFKDALQSTATPIPPRALRCVESAETLFGDALGRKYVERHFSPAAKAKVKGMIDGLLAALEDEVAGLDWMAPGTKTKALEQLASYDAQVGYPDTWKEDAGFAVRRDAFWANVAAGRRLGVDVDRSRVGKKAARDLWQVSACAGAGYIDFQRNQIVVPAGVLQPPAFSLEAADAVNYGAIGAALGHDLTHAIDPLGAQLDAEGRPPEWWTAADHEAFERRGQCILDQAEGYFIEPGVHLQGKRVESEAIADLAGVRLAYLAFERLAKGHPMPAIDGFTPEQQLFIAWGQFRGEDIRLEAQRQMVSSDIHPVARFRVMDPLSNLPEFQRTFGCKAGAAMVRPLEQRCAVW